MHSTNSQSHLWKLFSHLISVHKFNISSDCLTILYSFDSWQFLWLEIFRIIYIYFKYDHVNFLPELLGSSLMSVQYRFPNTSFDKLNTKKLMQEVVTVSKSSFYFYNCFLSFYFHTDLVMHLLLTCFIDLNDKKKII